MSKQANKKAIGAFVITALVLAVGAVVILGSGKFFVKTYQYVAHFDGSVKGLRVGAPVVFRGAEIGEVTRIILYVDPQDHTFLIPVVFHINPNCFQTNGKIIKDRRKFISDLIQRGLKAQLQIQSLVTGQLMINIDFYPDQPVSLIGKEGIVLTEEVIEIPTVPTQIQRIENTLKDIPFDKMAENINRSLDSIEKILTSEDLIQGIHFFKQTLQSSHKLIGHVDKKVDPLVTRLTQTLNSADAAIKDTRKVVNNINGQVDTLAVDLADLLENADLTLKNAEKTLTTLNTAVEEGSPLRYQMEMTLREMGRAARSIRSMTHYLERNPDALLRGRHKTGGQ